MLDRGLKSMVIMKNIKILALAFVVILCGSLVSCSDDDKGEALSSDIIGIWQCMESDFDDSYFDRNDIRVFGIEIGEYVRFFSGKFKSADGLVFGKKCCLSNSLSGILEETEADWDEYYEIYEGEEDYLEVYNLEGNTLIFFDGPVKQAAGEIAIDGDIMNTFKGRECRNGKVEYESDQTFVARFVRIDPEEV